MQFEYHPEKVTEVIITTTKLNAVSLRKRDRICETQFWNYSLMPKLLARLRYYASVCALKIYYRLFLFGKNWWNFSLTKTINNDIQLGDAGDGDLRYFFEVDTHENLPQTCPCTKKYAPLKCWTSNFGSSPLIFISSSKCY